MSAKPVEYHQGATADVKSAVAWYKKRGSKLALDFIEELHRASNTIRESPESWQEQDEAIPALAIPILHHLLGTRIGNNNLGCGARQQTTGVLDAALLAFIVLFPVVDLARSAK